MRTEAISNDRMLSNMLDELEHGLKEIYGNSLRKIILYGSYAREQSEPGSDLDLMVLCDLDEKDIRIFDEAVLELTIELTTRYGIFVSVVTNNVDFFYEWVDTLPYFKNVITDGITLHG